MLPSITVREPHLAITIPELVFRIFEQLAAIDLVSSAQVCKDWEWAATDMLWRCHAVKLSALLKHITPEISQIFEESPREESCLAFSLQSVSDDKWQNFLQQYSYKVTHLVIDITLQPLYGASSFPWSQNYQPICPKAKTVTLCELSQASFSRLPEWQAVLRVIAPPGPSLTSINVNTRTFFHNEKSLLASFESPFVTALAFQKTLRAHPNYTNFPALTCLTINSFIGRTEWQTLAIGCPYLRHLKLNVTRGRFGSNQDTQFVTFPSLQSFRLHVVRCIGMAFLEMIFLDCAMPELTTIMLSNSSFSASDLVALLRHLGSFMRLEDIEVDLNAVDRDAFTVHDIVWNIGWVRFLRRLRLRSPTGWFEMRDTDWEELSSWITRAKDISIEQEPTGGQCHHGTSCTINSLTSLATYCEDLDRLVISLVVNSDFDFHSIPIFRSLQSLTIQHLTVDEDMQLAFATFLTTICPNLQVLSISCLQLVRDDQRRVMPSTKFEEMFWANQGRHVGSLCAICDRGASAHIHR